MKVQTILKQKPYFAWDVANPAKLSDEAVLERVLNYGDWADVQKFIKIKGKAATTRLFKKTLTKKRINYNSAIAHYFSLYFGIK